MQSTVLLLSPIYSLDLLHKSEKGEAFADQNPGFTDKFERKCFAPTAKNRLLQEVYWLPSQHLHSVYVLPVSLLLQLNHPSQV